MNRMLKLLTGTAIVAGGFFVSAAQAETKLQGGGASFPAPIYQRWVTEYQKQHPDVKIDYQAIGSGGGIKNITEKTFDFAGSDAPLNKKQIEALGGADKIIEIPSVAGAVVLAFNIADFSGDLKLDGPTLALIFQGKISNWNDPKIKALNPDAKLPDLAITPAHRSDGSGTTFVFTSYLGTQSEDFKNTIGAAAQVEWPKGQLGGQQNPGVTQIVKSTNGGIGYVELAYAIQNHLPMALLKNKDGNFIKASPESVTLAGEAAAKDIKGNILAVELWNQPGEKVYPISAFTYIIAYKDLNNFKGKDQAAAFVEFLKWAVTDGQKLAPQLDYAGLEQSVQDKDLAAIKELTFKGEKLGQ